MNVRLKARNLLQNEVDYAERKARRSISRGRTQRAAHQRTGAGLFRALKRDLLRVDDAEVYSWLERQRELHATHHYAWHRLSSVLRRLK